MKNQTITIDCDTAVPLLRKAAARLRNLQSAAALVEGAEDPVRSTLVGLIEYGYDLRAKYGNSADARKKLGQSMKEIPSYLRAEPYADLIALDVRAYLDRLLDLDEFADVRGYPFRLIWRAKAAERRGRAVLGTCRAINERERLTWTGAGPAPFWEIEIALDAWLLATEEERYRLLHHEAMHADLNFSTNEEDEADPKPAIRDHDVQDFVATAGRFGAEFRQEFDYARLALAHPVATQQAIDWSGAGPLFQAFAAPVAA